MMTTLSALRVYAEANGGITAVATGLGVSKGVFWAWINRGRVPPDLCKFVSARTGVPVWHLRPSDWHRIWPDLIGAAGAPAVPEGAARLAAAAAEVAPEVHG